MGIALFLVKDFKALYQYPSILEGNQWSLLSFLVTPFSFI